MSDGPLNIRSFKPSDIAASQHLYRQGLIGGKIAENDTGLDIDDIESAYIKVPGNHFWVAEVDGAVIGMVGVMHSDGVADIRRLRVHEDHRRRGVGSALVETALSFCNDNNYLKVALDTFMEREPAIRLFEKFHFLVGTTRSYAGKELLYFYLDLYSREDKDGEG